MKMYLFHLVPKSITDSSKDLGDMLDLAESQAGSEARQVLLVISVH